MSTTGSSAVVSSADEAEEAADQSPRRPPRRRLPWSDRAVVITMVVVPSLFVILLVWVPAVLSIILSFGTWNGIGSVSDIQWVGTQNYHDIATIYPPFWPAVRHNLIWLAFLFLGPTVLGMFLAVVLDRNIRFSRFYQTAFYLPVVLSLALTGFIWQLMYSRDQGFINQVFGTNVDWYGDSSVNLWAILGAVGWRHAGYIMILYLAGLKAVDPSLREAAAIDGASEARAFFKVVLPALKPINIVVVVITVIEALRAFDIVYIINNGRNGLELMSVLITDNIIGEASRIGYGSAIAVVLLSISVIPIVIFVWNSFKGVDA